ncbi:sigma-70 family RNA polymerase sigma factor [Actinoplanes oblitus]|uniref:Sigma-70 family RNA polymerase sigma factor n=1 Tax=Actinoplanes oblitus TaxID=3040509 RepID=A0ABY8WRX8_9ACTN|nr:sigma-70 family RNA polymerase sigma factor [Actinoplanes oblitus]WIN00615.1 sigma-70 family RNA polymerase sigma factor [Actinoplanes oblitus]
MTQPDITGVETDADLIEQAGRAPERFTAIFDRHYQAIYQYVTRRLGPDLAEDVASETFLIAFDRRQSFDADHGDARPWLFGIASNLVARHVRAESRRYQALARAGGQDLGERRGAEDALADGHAGAVAGRLDAAAARGRLAEALAALPEPVRAVLLLVAWAGLNQQEAAAALGIPAGTARSRLHRARQAMRQALGAEIETER